MGKSRVRRWFASRPPVVQELARRVPPGSRWTLRTQPDGDYYLPYSYNEDGSLSVIRYDRVTHAQMWGVFGMSPDDLLPMRDDA